jgi:hypothetical protein
MKQLKLILFLAIAIFASCEKEKIEVNEPEKTYKLKVDYESSKGNVTIEPMMEKYPGGTNVKITAQAAEGKVFKYWKYNEDTIFEEEINITMESNISLEAVFVDSEVPSGSEEPDSDDDSKADFNLEIKWVSDNIWEAEADLLDFRDKEISNAVIKVDGISLEEDDFYKGTYKGVVQNLAFGQQFNITLQFNNGPELTFHATTPVSFTKIPSLTGSNDNGTINMEWESVECSGYYFYKKLENNNGATATVNVRKGSPITETSYSTSVDDIYNDNVSMSPAPSYFTLWICPVNSYENLSGALNNSYIEVIGKKTNSLTNKKVE